jgi:hypothetical protein
MLIMLVCLSALVRTYLFGFGFCVAVRWRLKMAGRKCGDSESSDKSEYNIGEKWREGAALSSFHLPTMTDGRPLPTTTDDDGGGRQSNEPNPAHHDNHCYLNAAFNDQ